MRDARQEWFRYWSLPAWRLMDACGPCVAVLAEHRAVSATGIIALALHARSQSLSAARSRRLSGGSARLGTLTDPPFSSRPTGHNDSGTPRKTLTLSSPNVPRTRARATIGIRRTGWLNSFMCG